MAEVLLGANSRHTLQAEAKRMRQMKVRSRRNDGGVKDHAKRVWTAFALQRLARHGCPLKNDALAGRMRVNRHKDSHGSESFSAPCWRRALKRKASTSGEPEHQPNLGVSMAEAQQKIAQRIEVGHGLIDRDVAAIKSDSDLERVTHEYEKWSAYNAVLLGQLFDGQSIAKEYQTSWRAIVTWERSLQEEVKVLRDDIQEKINKLDSISARLELYPELKGPTTVTAGGAPPKAVGRKVFVVHGHDEAAKEKIASLLGKLKLEPVILHQKADQGKTVIEKFEQHADVDFAVVILTPDDVGGSSKDQLKPRARQNVILEQGFFLGKLGRSKVRALYKGDVEIPSDYAGVLYILMDEAGAWETKLAKELKAAGIEVDLNLLVE